MTVLESTPDSQVSHHYQTVDPAEISLCAKEAKVSPTGFTTRWMQTRAQRTVKGSH
jgi:hypothetical protein